MTTLSRLASRSRFLVVPLLGFALGHGTASGQNRPARPDAPSRADAAVAPAPAQPAQNTGRGRCAPDMVLVEGNHCVNVDQRCVRWLDPPTNMRCGEFAPSRCTGRRVPMAYCMDRFEWPNREGTNPQVMVSWYEARRACEGVGKRLCTQREWTFACEGPEMNPYPYGRERDATACRIDHQSFRPDRARLGNPGTAAEEVARLYEAVPSGAMARCASWAGVRDLTGNVDEWTVNETGRPFASALKGGWWGPIRARCRPATTAHNEAFVYYQIGFRCCTDPAPAR